MRGRSYFKLDGDYTPFKSAFISLFFTHILSLSLSIYLSISISLSLSLSHSHFVFFILSTYFFFSFSVLLILISNSFYLDLFVIFLLSIAYFLSFSENSKSLSLFLQKRSEDGITERMKVVYSNS